MIPEGHHLKTRLEKDPPAPKKKEAPVVIYVITLSVTVSVALSLTLFERLFELNVDVVTGNEDSSIPAAPTNNPSNRSTSPATPEGTPSISVPIATPSTPLATPTDNSFESGNIPPPSNRNLSPSSDEVVTFKNGTQIRLCVPRYCNRQHAGSANFRSSPTLSSNAIKGVIPVGDCFLLTGRTVKGHGILWYEAINESWLMASIDADAQNRLDVGQLGWIADCFVN